MYIAEPYLAIGIFRVAFAEDCVYRNGFAFHFFGNGEIERVVFVFGANDMFPDIRSVIGCAAREAVKLSFALKAGINVLGAVFAVYGKGEITSLSALGQSDFCRFYIFCLPSAVMRLQIIGRG